jgi:2'-5' RNA ligase
MCEQRQRLCLVMPVPREVCSAWLSPLVGRLLMFQPPSSSTRHRFRRPPTGFIYCSQIFAPSFSKVRIVMSGSLFIAAVPPKAVTRPLADIHSQCSTGAEVTWEPEHRLHVTIRYFGKVDKEVAVAALQTLRTLSAVRAVYGLEDLSNAVLEMTRHIGEIPKSDYKGHITLGRARNGSPLPYIARRLTGRFNVDELVLMQSGVDSSGQLPYDVIDKIQLGGASEAGNKRCEPGKSA